MRHSIEEARQHYAEELRFTAKLGSRVIVDAFATVPRERFLGPGPWRVLSPMAMAEYWTTQDADPRHLYHDVLIAIDEARRLNNGQPSLWARMYDQLELSRGDHVIHVGAGTGYYSAILAEIVGPAGRVTAIEVDPILAARAKESLAAAWPQAAVFAADGFTFRPDQPADAIVVNAGVTHFSAVWLDALATENGRLLIPLTNAERWGCFLMITRQAGDPCRCRSVHRPGGDHPVHRRARSGNGGKIDGGVGEGRFHRHPIAAARPRRAGSYMLARRRGVVAVHCPASSI